MSDLARAVSRLVTAATENESDRALRSAVDAVMRAFDARKPAVVREAIRLLDAGIARATGRAAQVLYLALGALVEAGAPPELAWTAAGRDLPQTLAGATRFAAACVRLSGEQDVERAIVASGAAVAKKKPSDAAAWTALPSRSLAAVACLLASRSLRKKVKKTKLSEAAFALEDAVTEVGLLSQVLKILDGEPFLVLHPESRRGFRITVQDLASNVELYVLLMETLVGDPKKGLIAGKSIDAKLGVILRSSAAGNKKPQKAPLHFHMLSWVSLAEDGSLAPDAAADDTQWIWLEGLPAEVPKFGKERIVLLTKAPSASSFTVEPTMANLEPTIRVESKLSSAEVDKILAKLGKAVAKFAR